MCITDRTVERFREFERDKRGLDYQRATAKAVEIFFFSPFGYSIKLKTKQNKQKKLTKSHKMNKLVCLFFSIFMPFVFKTIFSVYCPRAFVICT